jgi:hypothetical protein
MRGVNHPTPGATAGLPSSEHRCPRLAAWPRIFAAVFAGVLVLLAMDQPRTCRAAEKEGDVLVPYVYLKGAEKEDWRPTFRTPTRVEAFRVDPAADPTDIRPAIAGFTIIGSATVIDQKHHQELASLLLDSKTYRDGPSACGFTPGIAVRFTGKDSRVVVVYCFHCDDLFAASKAAHSTTHSFSPGRAQLIRVMKKIFPKDKVVQALKEKSDPKEDPSE